MNIIIGDIGNTTTKICLVKSRNYKIKKIIYFNSNKIYSMKFLKNIFKKIIKKDKINKIALFSSVVPKYELIIKSFLKKKYHIFLKEIKDKKIKKIVKISIKNKKQVGSDRIANAVGAFKKYKNNSIVLDFGTATTFDVVDINNSYIGGIISPGVHLSMDALDKATARLPRIAIVKPDKVIGTNTISAMQSGIFWGYVGLLEGVITKIKKENNGDMKVIATGGLANLFKPYTDAIDFIDDDLTLKGIALTWDFELDIFS